MSICLSDQLISHSVVVLFFNINLYGIQIEQLLEEKIILIEFFQEEKNDKLRGFLSD